MTYHGRVRNGQITLDEPAHLPEGAPVSVELLNENDAKDALHHSRREILRMPLERRRQLLTQQSQRLAAHYQSEADRSDWQGGDIVE